MAAAPGSTGPLTALVGSVKIGRVVVEKGRTGLFLVCWCRCPTFLESSHQLHRGRVLWGCLTWNRFSTWFFIRFPLTAPLVDVLLMGKKILVFLDVRRCHGLNGETYSDTKVNKVFLRTRVQDLLVVDLPYFFPLVGVIFYSRIVW